MDNIENSTKVSKEKSFTDKIYHSKISSLLSNSVFLLDWTESYNLENNEAYLIFDVPDQISVENSIGTISKEISESDLKLKLIDYNTEKSEIYTIPSFRREILEHHQN